MASEILDRILKDTLRIFLCYDDQTTDLVLNESNFAGKQQIGKIEHLEVHIYSNDHNPPHFHVKSNDLKINAKFLLKNGEYLSGEISPRDTKKIKAFYHSAKGKIVMELVWRKFHG